ncbi:MAG: CHAT domain-containing tetratricopeptide repeat protein [Microscillaceae bacterium]|nr:CHAT domain-containing tetratricopeptide repeat protein [Microscillaceae bacterium]
MRTIIFLLIYLFSQVSIAYGQDISSDTSQANFFYKKAENFVQVGSYDSSLYYFRQAKTIYDRYTLPKNSINSEIKIFQCLISLSKFYVDEYEATTAGNYLSEIQELKQELLLDSILQSSFIEVKGELAYLTGDLTSALDYYKKAELLGKNFLIKRILWRKIGKVYLDQGKFEMAKVFFEKQLNSGKEVALSPSDSSDIFLNLGIVDTRLGSLDKAKEKIEKGLAIQLRLTGENHENILVAYSTLAVIKAYKADFASANEYLNKVLKIEIAHKKTQNIYRAEAYSKLGTIALQSGNLPKAEESFKKTLDLIEPIKGEKNSTAASAFYGMAVIAFYKGIFESALKNLYKSKEIQVSLFGESHPEVAKIYSVLGAIYGTTGDFKKALENHLIALKIQKGITGESEISVIQYHINLGVVYFSLGDYNTATEYYLKALDLGKTLLGDKHPLIANNYGNLGVVYNATGDYYLALDYFQRALNIYLATVRERHTDVANLYLNISLAYQNLKKLTEASEFSLKAIDIQKNITGELHPWIAGAYLNLGKIYVELQEYKTAEEYFNKAITIQKKITGETHPTISGAYEGLGIIAYLNQDTEIALKNLEESLRINLKLGGEKFINVSTNYFNIANVYYSTKMYDKSLDYHQKSIDILLTTQKQYLQESIQNEKLTKKLLYLLNPLQNKAQVLLEKYKSQSKDPLLLQQSLDTYELCDWVMNTLKREASQEIDKLELQKKAPNIYLPAMEVCQNLNQPTKSFYFSEKSKSTILAGSMSELKAKELAGIPDSLRQIEYKLKVDIAYNQQKIFEKPDSTQLIAYQNNLFKFNRELEALINQFEKNYPRYYDLKYRVKVSSVEDIQKALKPQQALISYTLGDSVLFMHYIDKKSFQVSKVDWKNPQELLLGFMRQIYNNDAPQYSNAAQALFQKLFPMEIPANINHLIIIPDVKLAHIPFDALISENPVNPVWSELAYLIKKYQISYAYSATLFYNDITSSRTSKPAQKDWIAFAPVFDVSNTGGLTLQSEELLQELDSLRDFENERYLKGKHIEPLPNTETEVKDIFNLFNQKKKKAKVFIRQDAQEEIVKSGELSDYRYIHFATHGFVRKDRPEISGIILFQDSTSQEDGFLYASEIYNLELKADLVCLSACETGLGKKIEGEGILGLSRALLYAGAKNMLVSFWNVNDASTAEMMTHFYESLLTQKEKNYSLALQIAKLKLISEKDKKVNNIKSYSHPQVWSGFVLVGN